ncbi:MAG: MFS transporter [Actinomycetia bacterium]|nr:MFS transporter [Actinomycetes bacterium]
MERIRAWPIYLTNFLLTSSLGVVFVFLEDVQTENSLADWEIGAIAANGFAAALVVQLLLAPLADRGRSTILAVIALIAGIVGPIGFAYGSSMFVLAASRGLSGIGLGLFGLLARKALLGLDATGGGAKLGILLSTAVAGFIAGPVIGAAFEPLGFEAPFLAVSLALAVFGIPATRAMLGTAIATAPVDYSDLGRLLARPKVQAAMLIQVVVFGFIGVFDAVVDRFLTDLGASTGQVAMVILFVGAPMLILPRFAGNLAERVGGARVMLPALFGLIPAMAGYGLAGALAVAAVCGFLHGLSESFASISAQVLVLEVTGAPRAAVGSSLLDAAGLGAASVAAAVAPIVYGASGQWVFRWMAVFGVVLGLIAVQRVRHGSDKPFAPRPEPAVS